MSKYSIDNIKHKTNLKFVFFWTHYVTPGCYTPAVLSQWYESPFTIEGITYRCAEQYMMTQKALLFNDHETYSLIMNTSDQHEMKRLGRLVKGFDSKVWDDNKHNIVLNGNVAKFTQNENLKEYILKTNDKIIVEASPYDNIWGIGIREDHKNATKPHLWQGKNLLGFILMEVRDIIQEMENEKK